jgi:hypothetical protein
MMWIIPLKVNVMETDLKNLPLIPDSKTFYVITISFYDCFDQLYNRTDFITDVSDTIRHMESFIIKWRQTNLILDYPGDIAGKRVIC